MAHGRVLEVVLTTPALSNASCTANLQDEHYQLLGRVNCSRVWRRASLSLPVPPTVSGVRLFFEGTDLKPQQLPQSMALIDHAR